MRPKYSEFKKYKQMYPQSSHQITKQSNLVDKVDQKKKRKSNSQKQIGRKNSFKQKMVQNKSEEDLESLLKLV